MLHMTINNTFNSIKVNMYVHSHTSPLSIVPNLLFLHIFKNKCLTFRFLRLYFEPTEANVIDNPRSHEKDFPSQIKAYNFARALSY